MSYLLQNYSNIIDVYNFGMKITIILSQRLRSEKDKLTSVRS
jgi:hypothetical protein